MKKMYFLLCIMLFAATAKTQIISIKSNYGDPQGASLGNRVIFINGATGDIGSTDGTVAGTVDIPSSTVVIASNSASRLNNKVVFAGSSAASGTEMWISDGTIAGTILLKDINPGPTGSAPEGGSDGYIVIGNTVYFTANDGTNGIALWKTDGTTVGTVMVKDLNSVAINFPSNIGTPVNNTLFFTANTGTNGLELWKSDGTNSGTVMVKEINPSGSTSFSQTFTSNGTYMFFIADNGTSGNEIWRTDGTSAGTIMLIDFPGGSGFNLSMGGSNDWSYQFFNNILYFHPSGTAVSGSKMYKTDGSIAGTSMVIDFNPGFSSYLDILSSIDIGTKFYFSANGELFSSDGTLAGTSMVKDINPGSQGSNPVIFRPRETLGDESVPGLFAGGRFFFKADNGTNGYELWVSDGTNAGTFMVKDIFAGATGAIPNNNDDYFYTKYAFFVNADNGSNGVEMWQTDGTLAGTFMVSDIYAGTNTSSPQFFGVAEATNRLVFRSTDATGADINALTTAVVPFPLTLTAFNATLTGNDVLLTWTTEQEVNFSHFNIQRSITGSDFITIASVNATGNGMSGKYQYLDKQPGKAGAYYYRLQMNDKDGKQTYSKIAAVKLSSTFSIEVTNTKETAYIRLNEVNGMVNLKLIGSNGTTYATKSRQVINGELISISIGNLPAGIYIVVVDYEGLTKTHRIMK
jgi:trimeric autotransporter adhesin